jgi:hypothetical protein
MTNPKLQTKSNDQNLKFKTPLSNLPNLILKCFNKISFISQINFDKNTALPYYTAFNLAPDGKLA